MALILRIKSKDGESVAAPIEKGMVIGRSPLANLVLKDAKMSGRHAQIEMNAQGQVFLVDLGSTNGIRFQGRRLTRLHLEPGTEFKIGTTSFRVEKGVLPPAPPAPKKAKIEEISLEDAPSPMPTPPSAPKSTPKSAPKPAPKPKPPPNWSDYFIKFITDSLGRIKSRPQKLQPFHRILQLTFVRGLQAETVWTLGYGPRHAGPGSHDLVIEERNVPDICFSVIPAGGDILFMTRHPEQVRLNEKPVKSDTLKAGDMISIGETRIRIGFTE